MPVDPLRVLAIIDETPHEGLRTLDRETLLATRKVLRALKRRWIGRYCVSAFVDEQQLN